jgi:hypothetical protein
VRERRRRRPRDGRASNHPRSIVISIPSTTLITGVGGQIIGIRRAEHALFGLVLEAGVKFSIKGSAKPQADACGEKKRS